jgi:hypothetical protein
VVVVALRKKMVVGKLGLVFKILGLDREKNFHNISLTIIMIKRRCCNFNQPETRQALFAALVHH